MFFYSHANKTHFHKKGCALGLILKVSVFGTRKRPIGLLCTHSRKRPALGTTTFSNFRGGRLRELRLYLYIEDKKILFADRFLHLFVKNS